MADLMAQIKEMLQMLEIMDPRSAAELRGQMQSQAPQQRQRVQFSGEGVSMEQPRDAMPADISPFDVTAVNMSGMGIGLQSNPYALGAGASYQLDLDLGAQGMANGIIYAELISPPLAKRRNRNRRS